MQPFHSARVYLDSSLLAEADAGHSLEELEHLAAGNFELVVLRRDGLAGGGDPAPDGRRRSKEIVAGRELECLGEVDGERRGDWLITADPAACGRSRPTVCRTVLIGPPPPETHHPTSRCDVVARDLRGAVLEILTADAMATVGAQP